MPIKFTLKTPWSATITTVASTVLANLSLTMNYAPLPKHGLKPLLKLIISSIAITTT